MPINFTQRDPNAFYKGAEFEQQNRLTQLAMQNQQQDRQMALEDRNTRNQRQKVADEQAATDRERELAIKVYSPLARKAIDSGNPKQFIGSLFSNPQTAQMLQRDGVLEPADLQDPEFDMHIQALASFGQSQEQQQRVQSAQILANGNIGFLTVDGRVVDTGQKAKEQLQLTDIGGAPAIANLRTASTTQLSTPEQEQSAAAAKAGAISGAQAVAKNAADNVQTAMQNQRAYETYATAIGNLEKRLGATQTDPITGRVIALTANAQAAEGAIAATAPILKALFRQAGEGTFTDRDQKLLTDMLPTRADHPEARKAKIEMINAIVKAKLGMDTAQPQQPAQQPAQAPTATGPNGQKLILQNGQWVPLGR